ncbi:signal peptide peptidase SppA [Thermodesulfobacteriota bacterium]
MFSRRHPYLFFILTFTMIVSTAAIGISLLIAWSIKDADIVGMDKSGEKVGVIEIAGVISESKHVIRNLKRYREDDSIKAIVMRIDSPGGAVGPSQEIYREIKKTIKAKTVIASLGTLAASGGYYIASGTNGIIANPGTITGSIGVIMGYTDFQQILQKIGLVPIVFKSGAYKDMGSPVRDMTDQEKKILQGFVDKIHRQFVRDVAAGRKKDLDEIGRMADGRIYTGEEAKQLGLVDRLGNLNDSIDWAGQLGGIKGKIVVVYAREKKFTLLRYITGTTIDELYNRLVHSIPAGGYLYQP